jgi:hypothetical protein
MPPFGYSVWLWLKANPAAQWLLGIAAAYAAFRIWLWRKIVSVRREVQEDARDEIIEQIEEQTHERIEDAREASRSTDDLNAEQLRKLRAADPNNRSRVP